MTKGILLCAHDNHTHWYGKMAYCCALMINHHMGNQNIALMTDETTWNRLISNYPMDTLATPILTNIDSTPNKRAYKINDKIKIDDYHNTTRKSVFDLTPFDETLVIDVDMLILNNTLNLVWGSEHSFMMNKTINSVVHPSNKYTKTIGDDSINMYWATVFYFKKTKRVQQFFEVVNHIANHYDYYSLLYRYPKSMYRNDYTFSVAAHIMSGRTGLPELVYSLPISHLTFAWEQDYILKFDKGSVLFRANNETPPISRISSNVHCMNKSSYEEFSDRIIELYA